MNKATKTWSIRTPADEGSVRIQGATKQPLQSGCSFPHAYPRLSHLTFSAGCFLPPVLARLMPPRVRGILLLPCFGRWEERATRASTCDHTFIPSHLPFIGLNLITCSSTARNTLADSEPQRSLTSVCGIMDVTGGYHAEVTPARMRGPSRRAWMY